MQGWPGSASVRGARAWRRMLSGLGSPVSSIGREKSNARSGSFCGENAGRGAVRPDRRTHARPAARTGPAVVGIRGRAVDAGVNLAALEVDSDEQARPDRQCFERLVVVD